MRVAGLFSEKQEYQTTSLVDLPGTWDEFLAGKSHNARREFRRTLRDLSTDASVEYIRHRPAPATRRRRRPAVGSVRHVRIGRAGQLAGARRRTATR